MIRAVRVELTRLRWRRAVLVLLLGAVVLPLLVVAAFAWSSRPVSEADLARAEEQVQRDLSAPGQQRMVERCARRPARFGVDPSVDRDDETAVAAACEELVTPQVEWYLTRTPLSVGQALDDGGGVAAVTILTLILMLVGATFAGHDWHTGSIGNQLLFESRRTRLWVAKGAAVALTGTLVAAVTLTAFWTLLTLAASVFGEPSAPGTAGLVWAQSWRGTLLAAGAALGGYALTMLVRSTVVTLGLLFAVTVAAPLLLVGTGIPGGERVTPQFNGAALLTGEVSVVDYDDPACLGYGGDPADLGTAPCAYVIDRVDATVYFGSLLLLACAASVLSFRRRDVA